MADIKQTPEWAKYLAQIGWKKAELNQNYAYIHPLSFLGSRIRIPRPTWPLDLKKIDALARQHHALFVKITPKVTLDHHQAPSINDQLLKANYIKDYWTLSSTKTSIIDLTPSRQKLFQSFRPKTRQYIRLAKKNGVKISQSPNIALCHQLYVQTARRQHFAPAPLNDITTRFKVFNQAKKAILLVAHQNSQPVATLLILLNPKEKQFVPTIFAISNSHSKLRASYLIVWEALILAKKLGFTSFDFDALTDKKYPASKSWTGTTFFKQGFGGYETSYLGSYIKFYNPIAKLLFLLTTKLTRQLTASS